MKKNLDNYKESISQNIEEKLNKIYAIEDQYELEEIVSSIKDLTESEKEIVFENLINENLLKIKEVNDLEKINSVKRKVDEALDFFERIEDCYEIIEEADSVSDDLICKLLGNKNRKLDLPIKVQFIKDFCIHGMIEQKDIEKTLTLIVIKLSTINYCLKNN